MSPVSEKHARNDDETELDASLKRLCDVKRRGTEQTHGLEHINAEIQRLFGERHKAENDLRALASGPHMESCRAYSQAWNRSFALKLLRLPRELRDMVYENIWTRDYLSDTRFAMIGALEGLPRDSIKSLPHVIDAKYMGAEIALEVVEAYYRHASRQHAPLLARHPEDIDRLVRDDVFGVGLSPATVLRELIILFDLDNLNQPFNMEVDVDYIKPSLESLLNIVKKQDFKLNIELSQRRIRLNLWEPYIDMLRPILHAFESEGAQVRISWHYSNDDTWDPVPLCRDLDEIIRTNGTFDKEAMAKSLDSEPGIEEKHREYWWENDSDYNPEDFSSDEEDDHREMCMCMDCSMRQEDYGSDFEYDDEEEDDLDDLDDDELGEWIDSIFAERTTQG